MKLDTLRFALAAGIVMGGALALGTAAAVLGVPGYKGAVEALVTAYGPYGYTMTWPGVVVGAGYGFLEGFIWLGLLAVVYNRLLRTPR